MKAEIERFRSYMAMHIMILMVFFIQLIEAGKKPDDQIALKAVVSRFDLSRFSADQLLEFGKEINNQIVWLAIINTNKLSHGQLIVVGKHHNSDRLWKVIVPKLSC